MRRWLVGAFAALVVLPLAGCGGESGASEFQEWEGPPQPRDGGSLDVGSFNDFLAEYAQFAWSPVTAATLFLRLDRTTTGTTSLVSRAAGESATPVRVDVTVDGLLDDSVRARRYVLVLNLAGENEWRLSSAIATQRCQQGRGHQAFTAEPCV